MQEFNISESTILVIDDSKFFLKTIADFLSKSGCRIITCDDAKEAIKALRNNPVDVIISDFEMPDFSGPELCEYLKSDEDLKAIPLIMLTGNYDQESFI